jgi:hypothetical protein
MSNKQYVVPTATSPGGGGGGGGSGTVTSVGLSINSSPSSGIASVTGSPVTTSGTLNINLAGTSGGIPYFSSGTVLSSSNALGSGQFVLGGGAGSTPTTSFSIVPVANGGTALSSGTSGGILGFTASGTIASSTLLASTGVVLGAGAGATPTTSSLTYSQPTLTISSIGNGNAIVALSGNTSGTATFTAPAVAGTITNPVVSSNALQLPGLSLTGLVTTYNNIATVSNGVPAEYATVDLVGQTTAITTTTLYTPTITGLYRISVYEKVTTAAGSSSSLGGANGTVIGWTDGTDSVSQSITMALSTRPGGISTISVGNATITSLNGQCVIYAKSGVAITYAIDYTSSGSPVMAYEAHIKLEAL